MTIEELIKLKIEVTQKELERLKLLLPNDKEYKRLIKSIYPKDSSKKFRR